MVIGMKPNALLDGKPEDFRMFEEIMARRHQRRNKNTRNARIEKEISYQWRMQESGETG